FIATYEDDLKNQLAYRSNQNQAFFDELFADYRRLLDGFEGIKAASVDGQQQLTQLEEKVRRFSERKQSLKEEFADIERKLAGELKQAGVQAISPQEFRQLRSLLDQAEQTLKGIEQSEQQHQALRTALLRELATLDDLWHEEYSHIERILQRVSRDDSSLRIVSEFKGDKAAMLEYLKDLFRGSRIRETSLTNVVGRYSDFGAIWRDVDEAAKRAGNSGETFVKHFEQNLENLLIWQVPNRFTILYRGKALQHHSLGQRASALMLFLLSQRDNDLVIIDQPEDDLDNRTLYDDVIKLLRELKLKTQFIFATHNANIPVLGDAEQVLAFDYQDETISVASGSIDRPETQHRIVNIMEGGEEAFNRRKQVYSVWKPQNS
ncbi:MAG: AAA family ATPase, partial [Pseudomonadota bacterium]|nr:AAA family ATPase [Pseudomonadota bacterium]